MHVSGYGLMVVLVALGAVAQKPTPATPQREITFVNAKPMLGLPMDLTRPQTQCSSDGLAYFKASGDQTLDLYSVSSTAEVKHFRRVGPNDLGSVSVRDFFPADHTLVSLLEADQMDERDPKGPPREAHYFLSVSDHDGDQSALLPLNLGFIPFRVGLFGDGEYLVLGWEEGNQLPKLVVLKEDGSIRRFVDFTDNESRRESLAKAQFVPFGSSVLLTYPGTARPVRMISSRGQDSPIPIAIPVGFVLHDVLVTGYGRWIVARVQSVPEDAEQAKAKPVQRIFEFDTYTGARVREFIVNEQTTADVTCAANSSLTAIFAAPLGDVPAAADGSGAPAKAAATQLVVATVRR